MTVDNFQTLIEELSTRHPFQPFTVELLDGQRYEIDHSHALAYRHGVASFLAPGGVPIWFDHESVSTIVGDTANTAT